MNFDDIQKELWTECQVEALKRLAVMIAPNYFVAKQWIQQIDNAKYAAKALCQIKKDIQQRQHYNA